MSSKKPMKPNDADADDVKKKKGIKPYPANSKAKTGSQAAQKLGLF